LSRMNASASQTQVQHGDLHADHLLQLQTRFLAPFGKNPGTSTGLFRLGSTKASRPTSVFTRFPSPHVGDIQTHCFAVDEPFEAARFEHWLSLLTAMRGEKLLRFKGLIHIAEHPSQPLVVHAAQHLIHPPERLTAWPDEDRRSRLVFITHGIPKELIESTLLKYAGACATALPV
ncbi:MAG TPA: GTP-binding protein, partial [Hydrogenophaga sp.]|nr:GTP-binding protein [Hydrogenophaga sp.]